ncbi:MAG: helix-turn-helix domain-containing protein [Thermoanaerobaculia bacterium]
MTVLSFGNAIRWRREARHIGLRALARATSLSPSYLSRIERDRVPPPSVEVIERLAGVLNASSEDLFAAAGILPDGVLTFVRNRPGIALRLLTLLGHMSDDEIADLLFEMDRRPQLHGDRRA